MRNVIMKQVIFFSLILLILVFQAESVGQQKLELTKKFKIGLTARSYGDSVYLRWVVTDPIAWRLFKENGLILERARINSNGIVGNYERLSSEPIKPWPIEKWEEYFNSREMLDQTQLDDAAIAFSLAIGEKADDENKPHLQENEKDFLKSITEKKSSQEWGLLLSIIAANNNLKASEGLGLFFVDRKVSPDEKYSYRIYSTVKNELYSFDTAYCIVKNVAYEPKQYLQQLKAIENDGSIEIIWKLNEQFSTFNVERSENGIAFKRMNDAPLLTLKAAPDSANGLDSFIDTLIVNYKPYYYRVYAKTVFADEVRIGEIIAMGRDRTPPEQPFVPQPTHIDENKVKIIWKMADPTANDLAGFYVGRDSLINGNFGHIHKNPLPKTAREFIDTTFSKNSYNFYTVFAFDTAGNISASYPVYVVLNDTMPPLPPKWEKAFMDSNGVVTLILKPNKEFDLMGYRILKSNSPEHEFSSVIESFGNDSIDYRKITEFRDTVDLNTTTKYVYYVATALDYRYNESTYSEIIAVPRPDIVPPVSPILTDAKPTDKDIKLFFIPSSSEDVKNHIIFKREPGADKWDTLTVLGHSDSAFTDVNVKPNTFYEYTIVAVDSSNLVSEFSSAIQAKVYYLGVLPEIKNFNVIYDEKTKTCNLSWDYDDLSDISFIIYRAYEDQPLLRYNKLSEKKFADTEFLNGKGNYKYAVKATDKFSGESKLSEIKNILIK